jgi:hypothetical protein
MLAVVVHAADVSLELLIAVLEVLDHPGELPDLRFESVDTKQEIGAGKLCSPILGDSRCRGALGTAAAQSLAAAEDAVEQSDRPLAFLCSGDVGSRDRRRRQQEGERSCDRRAKREACHCGLGVVEARSYHTNRCVQIVTADASNGRACRKRTGAPLGAGSPLPPYSPLTNLH